MLFSMTTFFIDSIKNFYFGTNKIKEKTKITVGKKWKSEKKKKVINLTKSFKDDCKLRSSCTLIIIYQFTDILLIPKVLADYFCDAFVKIESTTQVISISS